LSLPGFPATSPGHFIQIACRDVEGEDFGAGDIAPLDSSCDLPELAPHEFDWQPGQKLDIHDSELRGRVAMIRRPFSLAGRRDLTGGDLAGQDLPGQGHPGKSHAAKVELDIIHRVVGIGTDWMAHLSPGDQVSILGPLGNTFELPAPNQVAILVGGGVGIPPMLYLADALAGRKAVAFAGALSRDLLPLTIASQAAAGNFDSISPTMCIGEFARNGIPSVISTDDGSFGYRGFVTQALEAYLDQNFAAGRSAGSAANSAGLTDAALQPVIYTCGPEPMMKRVAEIAMQRGFPCQIAVERAMACGMGTCQSCVIKVRANNRPDGRNWVYKLACTDGPVFKGENLLW
jgi:dihydroorotate dehydrogenase electron transfer subunit